MKKSDSVGLWLTFLGMVGLYVIGYYEYTQYQKYKGSLSSVSGATSLLGSLFSSGGSN